MSTLNNISITVALATDSGYTSSEHIWGLGVQESADALVRAATEIARIAHLAGVDITPAWKAFTT